MLDTEISQLVDLEERRQCEFINLIASENYASEIVRAIQGSCLTNSYAVGYMGKKNTVAATYATRLKKLLFSGQKIFIRSNMQTYSHTRVPNQI